ncbi:hypothetical protein [Streptomyces sp. SP2-10]|uniref:hypothetical protein n=1 Tax=Streptomyces sp. SP2-10 TaxID=2873385 RepID=UPI001CA716EC|nr:hypothetical protein [Streptomyces sp. SP2-10]MBY8847137.1 hypothetical protein [Streptomyces sp. SP2-10]
MDHTRGPGARVIATCVLAVDEDGPRFAARRGFVEVERYVPAGERDERVGLRLSPGGRGH